MGDVQYLSPFTEGNLRVKGLTDKMNLAIYITLDTKVAIPAN